MKRAALALVLLLSSSASLAQVAPAQMGITPTLTPEVLQVLDVNQHWVPLGVIGNGHLGTPWQAV